MKTVTTLLAIAVVLVVSFNASASLIQVNQASFGANTVYESFEEPIDYANAQDHSNESNDGWIVIPGQYHDYIFSQSGISLTAPIPNTIGTYLPMVSIYRAQQGYGFGVYGTINSSNFPPDGTHFLVEYGSSSTPMAPYVLTLPGDGAIKVGGYWMMSATYSGNQDKIQIDAYGLTNNYLGTVLIPAASVNDSDWSNNFYGFEASDGSVIKKIAINYWTGTTNIGQPGVDMLMFVPAPEPTTMVILAFALGFTLLRRPRYLCKK